MLTIGEGIVATIWSGVGLKEPKQSWLDRARLAALFIRPSDTVLDIGAGAHALRRFLPNGAKYIAADCVSDVPDTHVIDLNEPGFTLPRSHFTVITMLGVLDHLDSPEECLRQLSKVAAGTAIIFTFDFGRGKKISSLQDGTQRFSPHVQALTAAVTMRHRTMFTGVLGANGSAIEAAPSATSIICRYVRPWQYLVERLSCGRFA